MIQFLQRIFNIKKPSIDENGYVEANRLPKRLPSDFSVELRFGGGKRIAGTIIKLKSGESSYYDYLDMTEHSRCSFIMTEAEIKEVFDALHLYKFDKVEMEEDIRLDYPSRTLTVTWDKKIISHHTGQKYIVKSNSVGNFGACVGLVNSIGNEKAKQAMVSVQIVLDESLQNPDSGFAIYYTQRFTMEGPYPWYDASKGKPPEQLDLLPGVYIFKCYCHNAGNGIISKSTPYRYSTYLSVTIPEAKSVLLKISTIGYGFLYEVTTTSI